MNHFAKNLRIRNLSVLRSFVGHQGLREVLGPLQSCSFQTHFVPRDPKSNPNRYKYPSFYDPYGPPPPPSEKIIQLADRIAALPREEREMIRHTLVYGLNLPKMQSISVEGVDMGPGSGPSKAEEKKAEKTAFDVKLEKFDDASKLKVIKEVRAITGLGLKESKDLVAKAPVTIKQGLTREEANDIIDKIKAAGGVAVTE